MKQWKRSRKLIKHHITNCIKGGKSEPSNLLKFDEERERAFHFIFHNLSFEEVAELLIRTCRAKGR
jgi:hypothetical protein